MLSAWDGARTGTASEEDFARAVQAIAALGICSRTPAAGELSDMYATLCDGRGALPLRRLLEPLDVVAGVIERRLRGIECRSWPEIDKWADETYNWYIAGRELRRNPATWRDAPGARGRNLYEEDRKASPRGRRV